MSDTSYPITPGGLERLRADVKHIKQVERPQNVREIEEAIGHGDLRENAEYHAAKETQAKIDGRLKYLEHRIANAVVIDPAAIERDSVAFGATVTLTDADTDEEVVYSLVGEDETDVAAGRISISAPISRALLGKEVGDEVAVQLPKGKREFEVSKVVYKALD